jgi:hypothetical protein
MRVSRTISLLNALDNDADGGRVDKTYEVLPYNTPNKQSVDKTYSYRPYKVDKSYTFKPYKSPSHTESETAVHPVAAGYDTLVEECGETEEHPVAAGYETLMAEIKEKVTAVDATLAQEAEEGGMASLSAETTGDTATDDNDDDVPDGTEPVVTIAAPSLPDANGTEGTATAESPVVSTLLAADEDQESEESPITIQDSAEQNTPVAEPVPSRGTSMFFASPIIDSTTVEQPAPTDHREESTEREIWVNGDAAATVAEGDEESTGPNKRYTFIKFRR